MEKYEMAFGMGNLKKIWAAKYSSVIRGFAELN
jgi:hypothetical protein